MLFNYLSYQVLLIMINVFKKFKLNQTLFITYILLVSFIFSGCDKPSALIAKKHHQLIQSALIDGHLSKNGKYSVILDVKNNVSLWNNISYQLIKQWPSATFSQQQYYVVLSNNQQWLFVAGKHSVTLLSVNGDPNPLTWQVNGFDSDAQISQILINSIGTKVIIGLTEGSVIVVDITNGLRSQFALQSSIADSIISMPITFLA